MKTTIRLIAAASLALPLMAGAQTTGSQTPSGSSIMSPNSAAPSTSGPSMPNSALPSSPAASRAGAMVNPTNPVGDGTGLTTGTGMGAGTGMNNGINRPTTSNRSMGTSTDKTPDASRSGMSNPTNTVDPTTTR